ncbi:MAG: hypothetical protein K2Q25_05090 [Mycobacteriaceae bacterium]|nr:hypothetical protein [Mycobacteriaceae bacterium]
MSEDFLNSLAKIAAGAVVVAEAAAVPMESWSLPGYSLHPGAQDPVRGIDPVLQLTTAFAEASAAVRLSGTDPRWVVKYLGVAVVVIQTLEYLNGFGPPDQGGDFHASSAQIEGISQILVHANPDSSQWSGLVADIYATCNKGLRKLVNAMSLADDGLVQILTIQSYGVEGARDLLAMYRLVLVLASVTAKAYCRTYDEMVQESQYVAAEAAAASCCYYGYAVASAAVGGACLILGVLTGVGVEIAYRIQDVKEQVYQSVYDAVNAVIHDLPTGTAKSEIAATGYHESSQPR